MSAIVTNDELERLGLGTAKTNSVLGQLPDYDEIEEEEDGRTVAMPDGSDVKVEIVSSGAGSAEAYLTAILMLAASLTGFYCLGRLLFDFDSFDSRMATLTATAVLAVTLHRNFRVLVTEPFQSVVYRNRFTGVLKAYRNKGFFLIVPWERYVQTDDFKNDEVQVCGVHDDAKKVFTAPVITTRDGFRCALPWSLWRRIMADEEGYKNYLRFSTEAGDGRIRAVMNNRLSIIGGKFDLDVLRENLGEVNMWVAQLFKGNNVATKFEKSIGRHIISPKLEAIINLDSDAEEIIQAEAVEKRVASSVEHLGRLGVSPDVAARSALVSMDKAKLNINENVNTNNGESVQTIHLTGVPNAQTVVVGGTGVVAGGQNQNPKPNNQNQQGGNNRRRRR